MHGDFLYYQLQDNDAWVRWQNLWLRLQPHKLNHFFSYLEGNAWWGLQTLCFCNGRRLGIKLSHECGNSTHYWVRLRLSAQFTEQKLSPYEDLVELHLCSYCFHFDCPCDHCTRSNVRCNFFHYNKVRLSRNFCSLRTCLDPRVCPERRRRHHSGQEQIEIRSRTDYNWVWKSLFFMQACMAGIVFAKLARPKNRSSKLS